MRQCEKEKNCLDIKDLAGGNTAGWEIVLRGTSGVIAQKSQYADWPRRADNHEKETKHFFSLAFRSTELECGKN